MQAVIPAVVHISAVQRSSAHSVGEEYSGVQRRSKHQSADRGLPPPALDELIQRFFGMPAVPVRATGSGFIIDPDGFIVTEDHVVENAEQMTVSFQDGKRHSPGSLGAIPRRISHCSKSMLTTLCRMSAGATAMLFGSEIGCGNPFGLDATVTRGIISGRGRNMHLGPYDDFLQIDAAINLGNSGAPPSTSTAG